MSPARWQATTSPDPLSLFAAATHLDVDQVPAALSYLQALLEVRAGRLAWVETQLRPDTDRFVLRSTATDELYYVERPAPWAVQHERRAFRALQIALGQHHTEAMDDA